MFHVAMFFQLLRSRETCQTSREKKEKNSVLLMFMGPVFAAKAVKSLGVGHGKKNMEEIEKLCFIHAMLRSIQ